MLFLRVAATEVALWVMEAAMSAVKPSLLAEYLQRNKYNDEMQVEQHWPDGTTDEEDSSRCSPEASGQLQEELNRDPDDATQQQIAARHMQTSDTSSAEEQEGLTDKPDQEQQHYNRSSVQDEPDADAMETQAADDKVDEPYVMAYLGRHMCPQTGGPADEEGEVCGGAMTPVGVHGDTYVCNMCGFERSESERVAQLAQTFQDVSVEVRQGSAPC